MSCFGLQERAAEGEQAEKDIPALTKCIEKLGGAAAPGGACEPGPLSVLLTLT